jgi:hypothetical protein
MAVLNSKMAVLNPEETDHFYREMVGNDIIIGKFADFSQKRR